MSNELIDDMRDFTKNMSNKDFFNFVNATCKRMIKQEEIKNYLDLSLFFEIIKTIEIIYKERN